MFKLFWDKRMFCSEHEATNFNAYNENDNNNKSVKCKTRLLGNTESDEKMEGKLQKT